MTPQQRMEIVERVWNAAQDALHPDGPIDELKAATVFVNAVDLLTVCEEAMAARHTDGQRYFDLFRKRLGRV